MARLAADFTASDGPTHWDRASYVDEAGFTNVVTVAYWDDRQTFDRWFPAARERWTGEQRTNNGFGTFIEALYPSVEGYETLFSSLGRPEGVAVLADDMSGEVLEHAYWGGMRDRIPLSQTSEMAPSGAARAIRDGARIRIIPHDNLCLIRSGQDWGDTEAAERKMYLGDVEPVLREGMDFLRDQGRSIGCYANRYMTVVGRRRRDDRKVLRHELVEKPVGAGTLGGIAPDPCQDIRRRHEVSVDARAGRKTAALPRGHRRPRRRTAFRICRLSSANRDAERGADGGGGLKLQHHLGLGHDRHQLAVLGLQPRLPDLGAAAPMHRALQSRSPSILPWRRR